MLDLTIQAGQVMLSVYESRPGAADDLERIAYLVGRIRARQRVDHVFILPYGVRRGHPFPLDTVKYPEGEGLEDKWDTSEPVRGLWRVSGCRPPANAEEGKKVQARRESVPHRRHP